jgi:IS30 family transposase
MTRTEKIMLAFNWQGGTIHQVNKALSKYFKKDIDIFSMSDSDFNYLNEIVHLIEWDKRSLYEV